jgi:hypothetical protein
VGFTEEELRLLDLEIDFVPGFFAARTSVEGWVREYGVQGVQGYLLDPESGSPVRSAQVALQDASGRVHVTGESNPRGFFRLQTPVPGKYLFTARALGYAEVEEEVVDVPMGHLAVLEVQMAPEALELEPLVVTAEARAFHLEMEGFYEREAHGLHNGIFLTPEFLENRLPRKVSDALFGLPGVRVGEPSLGAGPRAVWFRSGERGVGVGEDGSVTLNVCWPMVWVDRHLVSTGGLQDGTNLGAPTAVDDLVHGLDVAAVEVYRGASEVPPEFNGPNAGCGVIVLWTRRGGGGRS